jgi:hypothetical protein
MAKFLLKYFKDLVSSKIKNIALSKSRTCPDLVQKLLLVILFIVFGFLLIIRLKFLI